ncbi:hypothetical protein [Amphibacillus jilinensis]|uniref:hypothetical protein n=1 Tax=Amphibacillus jilinensis TaxID=1216008 RepID=UPI0002DF1E37
MKTHLSYKNYCPKWTYEGSYAKIISTLLGKEKVGGFSLEYDDGSGDFNPLELSIGIFYSF